MRQRHTSPPALTATLRRCLAVLALLWPLASVAQQPVKPSLPTGAPSREQLFTDILGWQDSLASLRQASPDTARHGSAPDSLSQQPKPEELALRADSLAQAHGLHPQVPEQLREAETRLRQQIEQAKEQLTRGLAPEEARQTLKRLEEASSAAARARLPQGTAPPSPGELQGIARARALRAVGSHFAGYEAKLRKARASLDKYKGRLGQVESVKEMPRGFFRLNSLKGRPWPERVIVGTQWQLGKQERYIVEMGSYAAWRLTDRLAVGAGLQYRLSVSLEEKTHESASDKVLGYFAFTDAEVYRGFFLRAHYERLSAPVPRQGGTAQLGEVSQEWVPGLSLGLGKSYTFYKSIKGYGLVQYNLLHERGQTPYLQPLQTKLGFYLFGSELKKRKQE